MLQKKSARKWLLLMTLVFSVTFYFGVFANPNFDIHEFCMGLSSEILGIVITVALVDAYIKRKKG